MGAVMHTNTIAYTVGESGFVAKAMNVVIVDGEGVVRSIDSRAR